jgi:large subunit ribosomal protein L9
MATREVILKEKIEGLGAEADVVTVKAGFASNYLIPQGKAYRASKANLRHLEALKRKRAEREAQELGDAQAIAAKIRKLKITLELATGKAGKAFGSVTTMDIAKALEEKGLKIDRHKIDLAKSIKNTGDFDIPIKLHADVVAELKLWVKAKASEAPEEAGAEEAENAAEEAES